MELKPEFWGIVHLLGHVQIAGKISEEERFGTKIGRVDVPTAEGFRTEYFGSGSIYRIQHATEEQVRNITIPKRLEEPRWADAIEDQNDEDDESGEVPW